MISIAMATYNGRQYIEEQLDSILRQSPVENQEIEIVICDDCSTDGTLQILQEYKNKFNNIKIFENEKNLGYVKNFEKAISFCSGDYIALSDQDDIWLPNHLNVLYTGIRLNEHKYDVCGANAILVDAENKEIGSTLLDSLVLTDLPDLQSDYRFKVEYGNFFQGAAMMITKALAQQSLPFPDDIYFHDYYLLLNSFAIRDVDNESLIGGVNYINEPILRYRQHNSNVTENKKFSLWGGVKNALFKNNRRKIGTPELAAVRNYLIEQEKNTDYVLELEKAIWFHTNLSKGFPFSVTTIPFICKNYYRMYRNRNKKLLIARLVKRLFGFI